MVSQHQTPPFPAFDSTAELAMEGLYLLRFETFVNANSVPDQWRSEGGRGGGHLPPGAARRGAPKSCQRIFKNLYKEKF